MQNRLSYRQAQADIMENFCDFITDSDWCSVAATIIAAIVAAVITYVLGRRQNKLQEQQLKIQERQNDLQEQQVKLQKQQNEIQEYQTKLQERQFVAQGYDVYKRLYILLGNANREIDVFIDELDELLWEPWHNSDKNALNRKKAHIDNLFKDLKESYVDYELKLSEKTFNKAGYLNILNLMSRVLQHTIDSMEKGEVHLSQGPQTIYNVNGDMEEGEIQHICSHFKQERMVLNGLYQSLKRFVELKKEVRCDDSLLESIRAKCKID